VTNIPSANIALAHITSVNWRISYCWDEIAPGVTISLKLVSLLASDPTMPNIGIIWHLSMSQGPRIMVIGVTFHRTWCRYSP
jgi:hypothetical protein